MAYDNLFDIVNYLFKKMLIFIKINNLGQTLFFCYDFL